MLTLVSRPVDARIFSNVFDSRDAFDFGNALIEFGDELQRLQWPSKVIEQKCRKCLTTLDIDSRGQTQLGRIFQRDLVRTKECQPAVSRQGPPHAMASCTDHAPASGVKHLAGLIIGATAADHTPFEFGPQTDRKKEVHLEHAQGLGTGRFALEHAEKLRQLIEEFRMDLTWRTKFA